MQLILTSVIFQFLVADELLLKINMNVSALKLCSHGDFENFVVLIIDLTNLIFSMKIF